MEVNIKNYNEAVNILKEKMRSGEVTFTYLKKDGSERTARGTLNADIMGVENVPKGTGDVYNDNVTRYFDLNSNGWRSFINSELINIDDD